MLEQIRAGVCQDITDAIAGDSKDSFYTTGVQSFMSERRSYGLPDSVGPIVFWYNRELCEKAGVDPSEIKNWGICLRRSKSVKRQVSSRWPSADPKNATPVLSRAFGDANSREGRDGICLQR
jgi:maltose-binding protein MalE